jgi:hypothetical protein
MKNINLPNFDKRAVTLFLITLIAVGGVAYNVKSTAQTTTSSIPTSGSCALLMTMPIPYGLNVANNTSGGVTGVYQTGYNLIGQVTFTSATSGKFSGRIVNPTFNSGNSPFIANDGVGVMDLNDWNVVISPMSNSNGFSGGYVFSFSGTSQGNNVGFTFTGVSANSGKTIMLISSGSGQLNNPGFGPGSGLCQV